ncbi:LysR family transcriptional regulator [Ruania halotolerans]|uniref:LysR family transcriptional regulator n=1 Tax=Ruania halotolerans TaxID=2897773 RepID=UPI001E460F8C|nr:LysR family transcriptional regulator [Ruania halotolerans]UFU06371.1 LysR family transcriptional regulator [Ruania halotolerans]
MWDAGRLRLLRELQLRGTVTAVAHTLNFSVSTVSHQLARLEREVGEQLLEPDGRRVRLTPQGRVVAEHAARMMDAEEAARGELEALEPGPETVRVASLETAARALLPAALDALAQSHPQLRVEVAVVPPEVGLFELQARRFDLTIAEEYPGSTRHLHPGLDRMRLGQDPVRLCAPAATTARSLPELADQPWVMEPPGAIVRDWGIQQCRAAGIEPDVRYEATDLTVHIRLIAAGHAVGILPDLVWAGYHAELALIDLPGAPYRELFTSARPGSRARPAVQAVHDALAHALRSRSG